jgi:hypothetical protein
MPDYAAPLQRLVLSKTLWLVIVWPLVGLAWQLLVTRSRMARARGQGAMKRALASARNSGIACVALAMSSTLAHAVVLAREDIRGLLEHIGSGARFGELDAEVDLSFDRLSATCCMLACSIALTVAVVLATAPPPERGWRPWAWIQLSLAGALVTFVADGFVGVAIGWAMVSAAGAWLAGWDDSRRWFVAAMRGAIAMAAMLAGAILLFWGQGGSWDGDDYLPDSPMRFATVRGLDWLRAGAADGASLTLTNMADAEVFIDDARTPVARSPFVKVPVPAGTHALRVRTGDGSNEDILGRVNFDADTDPVVLVPLGPALSFRAIAEQLVLVDATPGAAATPGVAATPGRLSDAPARPTLELHTGPGGALVVASSLVALLLAAGLISGASPSPGAPLPLGALAHGVTIAAIGPYLLARVAFLFPLAPNTWIAIESVGAVILLAAGWRAPTGKGARRWLAFVGVAPAALAFLALGASGVFAMSIVMTLAGIAAATLYLVAARGHALDHPEAAQPSEHPDQFAAPSTIESLLLIRIPAGLSSLLVSMDRWVVGATASALATAGGVGAWVTATVDEHLISAPANAVAARLARVGRSFETTIGARAGSLAWALLAIAGLVLLVNALWLGR